MKPSRDLVITNQTVETLLAKPLIPIEEEPCKALETVALVLSGDASAKQIEEANAHLAGCETCRRAVLTLDNVTARGVVPPHRVGKGTANKPLLIGSGMRRVSLSIAATILVVLVAGLLWQLKLTESETSSLVVKGDDDELHVAVERQGSRFVLRPGSKLKTNDVLGFFYSTDTAGYLAVFNLDNAGVPELLYPAGQTQSASVEPGLKVPLPDGGVVQAGQVREWFIAVFSDEPLVLRDVAEIIAARKRASTKSETFESSLKININGARSVRIIPYIR